MSLATKLVSAIAVGRLDDYLEVIGAAVAARRRALVEIRAAAIKVGDTVVFCHNGKPQYLRNKKAKVRERLGEGKYNFVVELIQPTGGRRYRLGMLLNVSASMIRPARKEEL